MIFQLRYIRLILLIAMIPAFGVSQNIGTKSRPNVIILYFDDLGYGDLGANNPTGLEIPVNSEYLSNSKQTLTPNLDKLAMQGIRFTNGHSADAVCSPARYALLTGRYAWRTALKSGVLGGYSKTFMPKNQFTIANMFKSLGYHTAMVGKWHIGMQFYNEEGKPVKLPTNPKPTILENNTIDFSKPLTDTPFHHGFEYFYGTTASLDMYPYAWVESNNKKVHVLIKGGVVNNDKVYFTEAKIASNEDLKEGNMPFKSRPGVYDPSFAQEDYLQIQSQKVRDLMKCYESSEEPFFIYVPIPAPHEPYAIQQKFKGVTGFDYGDYLVQTDYYAGEIIDALGDPNDPKSLASNTIVFVTSDNGPENAAYRTGIKVGHDSNGPYKGIKRDNWEGGTRVPFIIRWPEIVKPKTVTSDVFLQGDFIATMADYFGFKLDYNSKAPDAESFLPVLSGTKMPEKRRPAIIQHSSKGQFAIVDYKGEWKLIDGTAGGGNNHTPDSNNNMIINARGKIGGTPRQLYNLLSDPGEQDNLLVDDPNNPNDNSSPSKEHLEKEKELYELLVLIRGNKPKGTIGTSYVNAKNNRK
ncbi:arylsulfatase [Tamlana fucoidanivorans]|uniref:Arylsulfatase n=1 Tax=Allotamlana fucoidanivorans TaxID=2583814 RepID=A0A5C4SQZ3_9FLAO|nr:arylsulfatase [Tamlana fucoidanivorans]TNJ46057.1 arylsulfatase [Tamlana fucoidanivorans]